MLSPQPPQIHSWLRFLGRRAREQPQDESWPSRQAREIEWTTPAAAIEWANAASRLPFEFESCPMNLMICNQPPGNKIIIIFNYTPKKKQSNSIRIFFSLRIAPCLDPAEERSRRGPLCKWSRPSFAMTNRLHRISFLSLPHFHNKASLIVLKYYKRASSTRRDLLRPLKNNTTEPPSSSKFIEAKKKKILNKGK